MKDLEITTRSTVINLGLESDAEIGLWVQDNYSNIQTWLSSSNAILLRDWLIEAFPLPPESGEVEINYDKLLPKQEVVEGRRIVRKLPPRSFEDVFPPDVVPPFPSPAMEECNPSGGGDAQ